MKRTTTVLALALGLISSGGFAQSMAGFWLGVTYPSSPNQEIFNYTMTLTQTGNTLGGTAQTANPNVLFGGLAYISGQVTGNTVTFGEADEKGSTAVKDICFWRGKLTYNPVDESLTGTYENIVNGTTCTDVAGGTVELYRIVLKSGTTYCKGSPMNLLVTGKNIRWYTSAAKTNLLATGNAFSPTLTQTTTFYITQTLYKNESPPVPITIEVVDPTFSATTTNADCGQPNGAIAVAIPGALATWQYSLNGGAFQATPLFSNLGSGTYSVAVKDASGCRSEQSVTLASNAAPTISNLKTLSPACGLATGAVSLTATGGSGALTYSINGATYQSQPIFGNLPGGNYTAHVRDAKGCEATRDVSLPVSFSLGIANINTKAAICGQQDNSLTVTTVGGSGAIEYSVDGKTFQSGSTFSNLKSGKYTVLVRDGAGCTASQLMSVEGGLLIDDLKTTPPRCGLANGELSVMATGGVAPLAYSIDQTVFQSSPRFINLPGGTYSVRVRDASGCVLNKTVSMRPSKPLTLVSINAVPTSCGLANGRVSMLVSGGAEPIRFSTDGRPAQVSNTFDGLQAGTYTVLAQDSAGCTTSQSVGIAASTTPTITDLIITPEACGQQNASIMVTTANPVSLYTFSIDGQTFQPDNTFPGLSGGAYTVTVRDRNACTSTRLVSLPVDCDNNVHLPMAFSPNTDNLNDEFTVYFSFPSLTVDQFVVYDRWGGIVYSRVNFRLSNGEPIWNGQLANGDTALSGIYPYLLQCQFPDGTQMTYRRSVALVK